MKEAKENSIELTCIVYNINSGMNGKLLNNCSVLREYMIFTEKIKNKVTEYEKKDIISKEALDMAIDGAIEECIEEDVLRDFLLRRGNSTFVAEQVLSEE